MDVTDEIRAVIAEADAAFSAGDARRSSAPLRLLDRRDGGRTLIRGRLASWLRAPAAGREITLLMNSHAHRPEPLS